MSLLGARCGVISGRSSGGGGGGGGGGVDPLTIGWHTVFWAEDPDWTDPGDGNTFT